MISTELALTNGHVIHFRSGVFFADNLDVGIKEAPALLFLLTDFSDFYLVSRFIPSVVNCGYMEFCCIGPNAEEVHDSIDDEMAAKDTLGIVTTWFNDEKEACEYFVYALGAVYTNLVIFAGHADNILQRLYQVSAEQITE
jgi:hypothetical protein